MAYTIKKKIRTDTPQVGCAPYRQIHAHSTGNSGSTAQNEADYLSRKDLTSGFFTHVVGNGQVIQTAKTGRGAWDVGGGWNKETYAAVELIESHNSKEEFKRDYQIYCELLYDLAQEAGVSALVDEPSLDGIKTHSYCTKNQPNNGSDHIDPYPYLAKWGITPLQFSQDIANSKASDSQQSIQPIQPTKENSTMIYAFNVSDPNNKATYLFDGQKTIVFAEKKSGSGQAARAWDHYKGTYKKITGKDIPTQTKTKEQFALWDSMYPAQFIKF